MIFSSGRCVAIYNQRYIASSLTCWNSPTTVQFSSVPQSCPTANPLTAACQASLLITNSRSLLNLMSIKSVMHPTISSSVVPFSSWLQSFPASGSFQMSQFFASGGQSIQFQLQYQSFQWIRRTDFLQDGLVGFLAVQGTLKSLLQYHSSKASILQRSAFFVVQLSHPYTTTGKTIALTKDGAG